MPASYIHRVLYLLHWLVYAHIELWSGTGPAPWIWPALRCAAQAVRSIKFFCCQGGIFVQVFRVPGFGISIEVLYFFSQLSVKLKEFIDLAIDDSRISACGFFICFPFDLFHDKAYVHFLTQHEDLLVKFVDPIAFLGQIVEFLFCPFHPALKVEVCHVLFDNFGDHIAVLAIINLWSFIAVLSDWLKFLNWSIFLHFIDKWLAFPFCRFPFHEV